MEPNQSPNVETMRQEAMRQIDQIQHLLQQAKEIGLLDGVGDVKSASSQQPAASSQQPAASSQQPASGSPDGLASSSNTLNNERAKLAKLDMVLAVVGTMKAGKSSTINAIVGQDVMPNRNTPMTTLPTLIRHNPEHHTPVLHFEKIAPVEQLVATLQQRIQQEEADCPPVRPPV